MYFGFYLTNSDLCWLDIKTTGLIADFLAMTCIIDFMFFHVVNQFWLFCLSALMIHYCVCSDEWSHYSSCISYHGNECIVEDVFSKAAADKVLFVKVEVSNSLGNRASNELMLPLLLIGRHL